MLEPDALRRISLFGALSPDEIALVRSFLEERAFEPGALVVREGEPGRELFIIESGEAEVLKSVKDGRTAPIATLGPGAVFGEMSLVGILPRAATVRAKTQLRALVLSYARIGSLSKDHLKTFTILVMNLARDVCRRLYEADAVLGEFNVSKPDR